MPDVGVLSLTIESNAKQAAEGLDNLAGALERVQKAVGTELNLKGIVSPLNKLTKAINDSKSLANIGTFLNAVASYKKAFKELEGVQFNGEPIKQLKAAIGDGIKIGQAGTQLNNLRTALEGEWKTDNAYQAGIALSAIGEGAKSVPGNLGTVAKNVSAVAKALNEYADATEKIKNAVGKQSFTGVNLTSRKRYTDGHTCVRRGRKCWYLCDHAGNIGFKRLCHYLCRC